MSEAADEARRRERLRAAAGELAAGVCAQLVKPLRELREDLAVLVEVIDQHTTESRGPRGLTWKEVDSLRQQLVRAYLTSRDIARLASELATAVGTGAVDVVDMNKLVESGVHLGAHRVSADTELFVDLGSLPPVRAPAAEMTLLIACMVMLAADSAAGVDHSAISIRTTREADAALLLVSDNGRGAPAAVDRLHQLAADVLEPIGGGLAATSEAGVGSAMELRLPLRAP